MNKIITGPILLIFAVSMPAVGRMTLSSVHDEKMNSKKYSSKTFQTARYEAREKVRQDLESEEKNRKLIGWYPQLPMDIIAEIGRCGGIHFAKNMGATCRDMNNRIEIPELMTMRAFCSGKKIWTTEEREWNDCAAFTQARAALITTGEFSEDVFTSSEKLSQKMQEIFYYYLDAGLSSAELSSHFKVVCQCRKEVRDKIEQNNKDCLKAFGFAIDFDDVKSFTTLLQNNKEDIQKYCPTQWDVHLLFKDSKCLYRDWALRAMKSDSKNVFEFLVRENPFCCKNYEDKLDREHIGTLLDDIAKCHDIIPEKKEKFIALAKKYDCKTVLKI